MTETCMWRSTLRFRARLYEEKKVYFSRRNFHVGLFALFFLNESSCDTNSAECFVACACS